MTLEQTLSNQKLMNEIVTLDLSWNTFLQYGQLDLSSYTPANFAAFVNTPTEIRKRIKQLPEDLKEQAYKMLSPYMKEIIDAAKQLEETIEA